MMTWRGDTIVDTIVRKQDASKDLRRKEIRNKGRPDYAPSQASFAGVGGVKTTFTACSVSSLAPKTTGREGEMRIGEKDLGRILPSRCGPKAIVFFIIVARRILVGLLGE